MRRIVCAVTLGVVVVSVGSRAEAEWGAAVVRAAAAYEYAR